jgi:hypothetical protein
MFKEMKVWLLKGFNNDSVVIKTDAVETPQYKSAMPFLKVVDPRAKLKILGPSEQSALREFVRAYEAFAAELRTMGVESDASEAAAIEGLKSQLQYTFVKMEAQKVATLDNAATERLTGGGKTSLRSFTVALKSPGGLEKLGNVIAADLFIGNTDRFYPGKVTPQVFGGIQLNLRCLVNIGNVFIAQHGGMYEVGALDFMDPNSLFKDINAPLGPIEQRLETKWPARTLADRTARHSFAKDVIHDLEKILGPRKSSFSLKTKLGSDAVSRLETGMVQGAKKLQQKMELKYNPNRWTPGIMERYKIICQVRA